MKASLRTRGVLCLTLALAVVAGEPDDDYVRLYRQLQQADGLLETGRMEEARQEFIAVREALLGIQTNYPTWNSEVVQFRLRYVSQKLVTLPGQPTPATPERKSPSELDRLRRNVRELEMDREVLQAKLREALAARPAAVDPHELAKAEEKIKVQQQEIEALKTQSKTEERSADASVRHDDLVEARQALAQARLDLATQGDTLARLLLDKAALQNRLKGIGRDDELRSLREENAALKAGLEKRVGELSAQREADRSARTAALSQELATAREDRRALEAETRALRIDLSETREQLALARAAPVRAGPVTVDVDRLRALEEERDELRVKLDAVTRELLGNRISLASADAALWTNQVAVLRSRVAALEARRAPLSAGELALFKPPHPGSLTARGGPTERASTLVGAGSASLAASGREPTSASPGAQGVTSPAPQATPPNVAALIRLARDQVVRQQFPEAERTLHRALAESPLDARALSLLGQTEFRLDKLDEALDALSRSAQVDPSDSETFTYLGLTLSRKGLRQPAEAALWRAVQLAPGNQSAHYNLAVIYATQQPPLVELARFHYQKAVAAGLPTDAGFEKRLAELTPRGR